MYAPRLAPLIAIALCVGPSRAVDAQDKAVFERIDIRKNLRQFYTHPPVFEFSAVAGVDEYRLTISPKLPKLKTDKMEPVVVMSAKPIFDMAKTWAELPPRKTYTAMCEALAKGEVVGTVKFNFTKNFPFTSGAYPKPEVTHRESALKCAEFIVDDMAKRGWAERPSAFPGASAFSGGAYPALMVTYFGEMMLAYDRAYPDSPRAKTARAIAINIGRYAVKFRTSAKSPIPHLPLSHAGSTSFVQLPRSAAATSYLLDIYSLTKDKEFLDAALAAAQTLKKLQREDGAWPYRVDPINGKVVADYTSDQITIALMLDRLVREHKKEEFAQSRDRAIAWMLEKPVKNYLWQEQYEDIKPGKPYSNLQTHDAETMAIYLIENATEANGYAALGRKVLEYLEDQFVYWDPEGAQYAPGVLEQYAAGGSEPNNRGQPVSASMGRMGIVYLRFYKATGKQEYLDRAEAMADGIVRRQLPNGLYPTWYAKNGTSGAPWYNCAAKASVFLIELTNRKKSQ